MYKLFVFKLHVFIYYLIIFLRKIFKTCWTPFSPALAARYVNESALWTKCLVII